jgi:photosystem II stability/assembly factor-like uncharacterized protein
MVRHFIYRSLSGESMNHRSIVVFIFLCSSHLLAQSGWRWQNPLPQGNVLNAVRFSSANVGIAVGEVGTIQRTTDGGVTWKGVETNFTTNLNAVWMFSDQHAMIIGDGGIIVTTTDGGTTWNTPGSGTTKNLYAVHFIDANTGAIVGDQGVFLRTTNGGNSWSQTTPFTGAQYGVHFRTTEIGTVVGTSGYIYKTTNAGQNWTSVRTTDGKTLYCVQFANADSGIAAGFNNTVARTTDGGATWKNLSGVIGNHKSVHFTSVSNGFIASGGTILNTTNGGATWTPTYIPTYTELRSIHFGSALFGIAAGYYGEMYRTTDGGVNWNQSSKGTTVQLNSIHYAGANDGIVAGNTDSSKGTVLFTNDAGKNWRKYLLGLTTVNLYSCYMKNGSTAIVAGQGIYKTTDSGKTWTRPLTTATILGMAFAPNGDNNGYAVGKSTSNTGFVLRSTNSGDSWTTATGNLNVRELRGVFVHNSFTVTVVGLTNLGDPIVCRTTNSGTNWNVLTVAGANSVYFPSPSVGTAVGDGGKISRTTDAGVTWVPQSSGTTEALKSVSFSSPDSGFAVGLKSTILSTTNGGTTWEKQLVDVNTDLFSVVMTGPATASTVGFGGTILNTTNGGITSIAEGLQSHSLAPEGYALQQNYPNPFNPVSTIEFTIPNDGFTVLTVYDAIGRTVGTLAHEHLNAGTYRRTFNGTGLASGIYYYRIASGEFHSVKSMLLVK